MSAEVEHPVFALVKKLRRALRNGTNLKLTPAEAQILVREDIYQLIARLEAQELRNACAPHMENDINSDGSGCGTAVTPPLGTFAGSSAVVTGEAMSRGARQRLSEEVMRVTRRKKR